MVTKLSFLFVSFRVKPCEIKIKKWNQFWIETVLLDNFCQKAHFFLDQFLSTTLLGTNLREINKLNIQKPYQFNTSTFMLYILLHYADDKNTLKNKIAYYLQTIFIWAINIITCVHVILFTYYYFLIYVHFLLTTI